MPCAPSSDRPERAHGPVPSDARTHAAILVVEDDVLTRIDVAEELRAGGHAVIEAANADEALAVLQSKVTIDLVLTDVRMPGALDGIGLALQVRAAFPHIKVVMASGNPPVHEPIPPVDGWFSKPYDFPKLLSHIKALLE
jgi:CheY-like chemotaxis protein